MHNFITTTYCQARCVAINVSVWFKIVINPVLFAASSTDLLCPSGLNCYVHVSVNNDFNLATAQESCDSLGASLINIETEEEYSAIVTWLKTKGTSDCYYISKILFVCIYSNEKFCIFKQICMITNVLNVRNVAYFSGICFMTFIHLCLLKNNSAQAVIYI